MPRPVSREQVISIHAPRAGSDAAGVTASAASADNFNPRSPCGERLADGGTALYGILFQSTLPVRGAT